jgi:hypothetical protein
MVRFQIQERLVKASNPTAKPEMRFSDRAVLEAESGVGALRAYLEQEHAEPMGMIEKVGSMVVVNARRGDDLFVIQVLPKVS